MDNRVMATSYVSKVTDKPFANGNTSKLKLFVTVIFVKYCLTHGIGAGPSDFMFYFGFNDKIAKGNAIGLKDDLMALFDKVASYYEMPLFREVIQEADADNYINALTDSDMNEYIDLLLENITEWNDTYKSASMWLFDLLRRIEARKMLKVYSFNNLDDRFLEIVAKVLDVKSTDTFMDICSGYGVSTISLIGESNPELRLVDSDKESALISLMLLVVFGKLKGSVTIADTLFDENIVLPKADKIFIDPPFRIDAADSPYVTIAGVATKDTGMAAVLRAAECLNEGGLAFIAVPGYVLFGKNAGAGEVRKYILDRHLLKAVVTLPPMWSASRIPTNGILLSKEYNATVRFIDALRMYESKTWQTNAEYMNAIIDLLRGGEMNSKASEYSIDKNVNEISADTIVPAAYIPIHLDCEHSLAEINDKLDDLYTELSYMIKQLRT